jgi:hypothetical protein
VEKWLTFVGKYIREWEYAWNNVWSSDVPFDPELFEEYCRRQETPRDISNQHYVICMMQDRQQAQEYKL